MWRTLGSGRMKKRRDPLSKAVHLLPERTVNNNLGPHPKWEDSETRKEGMKLEAY